jgi:hypothetical protein
MIAALADPDPDRGAPPGDERARWHRDVYTLGHLDHGATIRAIAAAGTWSFGAIVGGFSESTIVMARRETYVLAVDCRLCLPSWARFLGAGNA